MVRWVAGLAWWLAGRLAARVFGEWRMSEETYARVLVMIREEAALRGL